MEQELAALRSQYVEQLNEAEANSKQLQAVITDRRNKIAAIDTLIGVDATKNPESTEPIAEDEEGGNFTPVRAYWKPILSVLVKYGRRARREKVIKMVGTEMNGTLTPDDRRELPKSNVIRWQNRVVWQVSNMKAKGYIQKDSPRGFWEITDEGRKWLDDTTTT